MDGIHDVADVFSDELSSLSLTREVEFVNDFVSDMTPISKAPCRVALLEFGSQGAVARVVELGVYQSEFLTLGCSYPLH